MLYAPLVDEETPHALNLYMVQLFGSSCKTSSISELRLRANKIKLCYNEEDIKHIEQLIRNQHQTIFWYRFGADRITASVFKRVCRTLVSNPSISLVKLLFDTQNLQVFKNKM